MRKPLKESNAELDWLNIRGEISEAEYEKFWDKYDAERKKSPQRAHEFAEEEMKRLIKRMKKPLIRKTRAEAERDLRELNLKRIVRRDARGRFSKRGRRWQAI